MGNIYLLCVAIMFSFAGTCAKIITPYFNSQFITFFRFAFGVFFLLLFKAITRKHFRNDFKQTLPIYGIWLLFGAVGKTLAYLTENYALTHSVSYGNILTQPAQLVFITIASHFLFKEHISFRKIIFMIFCVTGGMLVSWNGRPLYDFVHGNLFLTSLFIISGIFAGCHMLSQKKLSTHMDILDSNLATFSIASVLSIFPTIPITVSGALTGIQPSALCIIAILFLGFTTGIGFYLNAKAIPLVPFYMVPILQSTMSFFAILWAILFFHEPISLYIISGTIIFIIGIIGIQLSNTKRQFSLRQK